MVAFVTDTLPAEAPSEVSGFGSRHVCTVCRAELCGKARAAVPSGAGYIGDGDFGLKAAEEFPSALISEKERHGPAAGALLTGEEATSVDQGGGICLLGSVWSKWCHRLSGSLTVL